MAAAIDDRTVLLVGSAPSYPHGVIDPIEALSALALERGIGFHADACLGGFLLPFAERLGHAVPPFDFRLPGVSSMSADTHKYGYAAKGTSVVLYRGAELRHAQYFAHTEWPGGLYVTPTFAGSRPGALSAACWAALVSIGTDGYLDAARRILAAAAQIRAAIEATDGAAGARRPAVLHRLRHGGGAARDLPRDGRDVGPRVEPERPAPPARGAHLHHAAPRRARGAGALRRRPRGRRPRRAAATPPAPAGWRRSTAWPPSCPTAAPWLG